MKYEICFDAATIRIVSLVTRGKENFSEKIFKQAKIVGSKLTLPASHLFFLCVCPRVHRIKKYVKHPESRQ